MGATATGAAFGATTTGATTGAAMGAPTAGGLTGAKGDAMGATTTGAAMGATGGFTGAMTGLLVTMAGSLKGHAVSMGTPATTAEKGVKGRGDLYTVIFPFSALLTSTE